MKPKNPQAFRAHAVTFLVIAIFVGFVCAEGFAQSVALSGLRSTSGRESARAIRTDGAGNIFFLTDRNDGVRIIKLNAAEDNHVINWT